MSRTRLLIAVLAVASLFTTVAEAQTQPLPLAKGTRYSVKIDSSPQQAAIYVNDRSYGIQGYTPFTLKLPKGDYKLILELSGFKPREVPITITRSQAFSVTLERAPRPAILDLRAASDGSALGATILVDGTQVGTLPNRVEVAAGRHVIEVKKATYNDYRDNVEVAEGETRTLVIPLIAQPRPGSILVTSDAPNATVYVDGIRRDSAPAVINDLSEGAHTVEVRAEGATPALPPWKQVVNVIAGQQVKVAANLQPAAPLAPPTGSVKVLSSTPSAVVLLDGEEKGSPGVEIKNIPPGSHIVEVRAQGYAPRRQEVQIAAGELRVVAVDLEVQVQKQSNARLRVISPVPEVEVFIDGASVGRSPIDRDDLSPGKHFVVARKTGFADYKVEVDLVAGKTTEIAAELKASGSIRVVTNVAGAEVFLDGTIVGKTPLTIGDVGTGDHIVEMRLESYLPAKLSVSVGGGVQQIVSADLVPVHTGPTVTDLERQQREQCSFCGATLAPGRFNIDVGVGYPYFFDTRLIAGVLKMGRHFGLDVAIELRTNFNYTDVGIRPRVQIIQFAPFTLGADMAFFGGGGPTHRNDFSFEVGPIATLAAGSYVHINFRPYLQVSTDRLCPSVDDIKSNDMQEGKTNGQGSLYNMDEYKSCHEYYGNVPNSRMGDYALPNDKPATGLKASPFGQADPRDRFVTPRFMLQASVEIAVTRYLNVFVMIEGAPGQDQRWAFNSKFNRFFTDNDFPLYGRAGVTGKF